MRMCTGLQCSMKYDIGQTTFMIPLHDLIFLFFPFFVDINPFLQIVPWKNSDGVRSEDLGGQSNMVHP